MKFCDTKNTIIKFIGAIILCVAVFNLSASAQFDTATVLGTTRDSAGAVVPNAKTFEIVGMRRSIVKSRNEKRADFR